MQSLGSNDKVFFKFVVSSAQDVEEYKSKEAAQCCLFFINKNNVCNKKNMLPRKSTTIKTRKQFSNNKETEEKIIQKRFDLLAIDTEILKRERIRDCGFME
jgi:hypothetical protein